jgi:hypothetical protein
MYAEISLLVYISRHSDAEDQENPDPPILERLPPDSKRLTATLIQQARREIQLEKVRLSKKVMNLSVDPTYPKRS